MPYTGVFVRQVLGQAPTDPSQGSCGCPDILLAGQSDPGPAGFATAAAYATTTGADVSFSNPPSIVPNYVYLRGYQSNTTNGSNIFLYSVPASLAMWPQNWSPANVAVGSSKAPQNWAWAPPAVGTPPIVVTQEALIWTPPPLDVSVNHYCTISWADNSTAANPVPPPFQQLGYMTSFDELMYFLATHANMGWRNTSDHLVQPPNLTYTTYIETKDNPETVNITVSFNNITDGTFMVNVTGPVSYTSGAAPIPVASYLGGFPVLQDGGGLQFGANERSLLSVTYQANTLPMSQFASLSADISHVVAGPMLDRLADLVTTSGAVLPIQQKVFGEGSRMAIHPTFLLGSQKWNLQWASA